MSKYLIADGRPSLPAASDVRYHMNKKDPQMLNHTVRMSSLIFKLVLVIFSLAKTNLRLSIQPWLIRYSCIAFCTLIMCVNQAKAQNYPPGTFTIDGFAVSCGNTVTTVTPNIPDIAYAQPGRIQLHPRLNNYPTGVKLFVYAHECAHQFVGSDEVAADAWAIKVGRLQGWINPLILDQICRFLWFSPGDWTHFPGPQRCQLMIHAYTMP